jgi:hypothetical protein
MSIRKYYDIEYEFVEGVYHEGCNVKITDQTLKIWRIRKYYPKGRPSN